MAWTKHDNAVPHGDKKFQDIAQGPPYLQARVRSPGGNRKTSLPTAALPSPFEILAFHLLLFFTGQ